MVEIDHRLQIDQSRIRVWNFIVDWLDSNPKFHFQDHPGTVTFTVDMYDKLDSLTNMMEQVSKVGVVMTNFMKRYPEGVNLICFSQGKIQITRDTSKGWKAYVVHLNAQYCYFEKRVSVVRRGWHYQKLTQTLVPI